jgi:hypothetical protein
MRAIRHPRSVAACIAGLLVVAAGCGSANPSDSPETTGPSVSVPPPASSELTVPPSTETPTLAPTIGPSSAATEGPASEPPATAGPSSGTGQAATCTGSDANRDFYADAAAALDWAVYCPVLPTGWFVNTGEYTLRDGGRLTIAYKGPGGAQFALDQRDACASADGCAPAGSEVEPAMFGDRSGTLLALDGGRLAVFAADPSGTWLATGSGLEQSDFIGLAADLVEVSD